MPHPFNFPGKRPENTTQHSAEFRHDGKIVWKWAGVIVCFLVLLVSVWALISIVNNLMISGLGLSHIIGNPSLDPREQGFESLIKLLFSGCLLAAVIWIIRRG